MINLRYRLIWILSILKALLDLHKVGIEMRVPLTELGYLYPTITLLLDKPQLAVYAETNMRRMILQIDETNEKRVEYKLQPMNKKERQFVHELSDLYNIYSTGRDIEPNRYLVLIAEKGNVLL